MREPKKKEDPLSFSLPRASASDIRGKQSVRATFKLSEQAIVALNVVSVHLGIKQKSLFDHLMEDMETLQAIARNVSSEGFDRRDSIQKTYVLSRRTLSSLEAAAKSYDAPRDALVEYSIQRLLPIIVQEKEKHLRRKRILDDMNRHMETALALLAKTRKLLGDEDPVTEQVATAVRACAHAYENIGTFIERGKTIEKF